MLAEKTKLKEFEERPTKKVLEAKMRKRKRMINEMAKFKNKAENIYEQVGLDEKSKIREVGRAFGAAKRKLDKNKGKKCIVSKAHNAGGPNKSQRHVKFVDKRIKKDQRGERRAERRSKGKSFGGNGKAGSSTKKFKRRH